ncbi:MAG: RodZ domain-containing protein [Sphingomicrobium sp.]
MDEDAIETSLPPVGDQLRAARKKKKLSLEDIAAQTRIPLRHLESIEASDWAHLPAPTYSVGFAKSYAGVVDLDRTQIGQQLRTEMGDPRSVPVAASEVFEPADPARAMPKVLVIGAIIALVLLVVVMSWLNQRSLGDSGAAPATAAAAATDIPQAPATAATPAPPVAQGPVVLSASESLWMSVYDKGGASYFSGMLNSGRDFTVPATATAPMVKTAKPEALKIMVGSAVAPSIGPAGQLIDVSLIPADLYGTKMSPPSPAAPGVKPAG